MGQLVKGLYLAVTMRGRMKDEEGIIGGENISSILYKNVEIIMNYYKRKREGSHDFRNQTLQVPSC